MEPILELIDETSEEEIRHVSQTTGVLAHGAGTTGVQGGNIGITTNTDNTTGYNTPCQ